MPFNKSALKNCYCLTKQWQVHLNYGTKEIPMSHVFAVEGEHFYLHEKVVVCLSDFLGVQRVQVSGSTHVLSC